MEKLNIPRSFLYQVLVKNFQHDSNTQYRNVFDAVCQFKSVAIHYTERIKSQVKTEIRTFTQKIRQARKGTNAKKKFMKSIQTQTWPFKVLVSEFNNNSLKAQVKQLQQEKQSLSKELQKRSNVYAKYKKKEKSTEEDKGKAEN